MTKYFLIIAALGFCSCTFKNPPIEKWKEEVIKVEKEFNDMVQQKGIDVAFEYFAAETGVIKRGKKVIKGKDAIRQWYEKDMKPNETLTWVPTFVEVSQSGDLAYTYGDFVFTYPDSMGVLKQNKGIFHTVWKRQEDGSWRYVWD